jgi:hypothetical protein
MQEEPQGGWFPSRNLPGGTEEMQEETQGG